MDSMFTLCFSFLNFQIKECRSVNYKVNNLLLYLFISQTIKTNTLGTLNMLGKTHLPSMPHVVRPTLVCVQYSMLLFS